MRYSQTNRPVMRQAPWCIERRRGCVAAALLLTLALGAPPTPLAHATPIAVTTASDGGPGSLRQAILDANATPGADLIEITATGRLDLLSGLPTITAPLSIEGPGAAQFQIDGQNLYRVFDINRAAVTIADVTIQHGQVSGPTDDGAGIRSTGTLTLTRVAVRDNTASDDGAGVYSTAPVTSIDSIFEGNTSAAGNGGALFASNTAVISGSRFAGNTSRGDGGAIFALVSLAATGSRFEANQCMASSCDGGAIFGFSQTSIAGTVFLNNTAQDRGGAVSAPGGVNLTDSSFQDNRSVFGAGGALDAPTIGVVERSQFLDNTARSDGGAIAAGAAITVSASHFEANQSTLGQGGGLAAGGDVRIEESQFLHNRALTGGGLHQRAGNGQVVNSLFAGNTVTNTLGAALLLASPGQVELTHVTIAHPSIGAGAAVEVQSGNVAVTNTIIVSHTVGISASGGLVSHDYTLFFGNGVDSQGAVVGGAGSRSGDPMLSDPIGDDYHLRAGSAAIDAGTDAGVSRDVDGEPRPLAAGFDIGYDEADLITGLSAAFAPAPTSSVGATTTFTATVTSGADITYRWDFGDGSAPVTGNPVVHRYGAAGTFPVTVTAANRVGAVTARLAAQVIAPGEEQAHRRYLPLVRR